MLDGTGSYDAFAALLRPSDYDDPRLEDLIDQINHLPPRSRLFGLGARARQAHIAWLRELVAQAEIDDPAV